MQIDAHQHFWQLERGDYGWLTPALAPLYRDFLPADLAPELRAASVSATVLVQAAPTEAETRFLFELARQSPFVAGVVGWVDMAAQDAPDRLAQLKEEGGGLFKGIRPMIQDIADPDWVLSPSLDAAFDALVELDLRFDALVLPAQLGPLRRRLARHPELPVVIDHAAKPPIAAGVDSHWADALAAIAADTTAACKFSGLVTEAGPDWKLEDLRPVSDHLLAHFGPGRLMWGSDWPVLNLVADYAGWRAAAQRLVADLSAAEQAQLFGGTAAHFYGLD